MKRNGGLAAAAVRLLCVFGVGFSACLLPRPAGAAGSTWQEPNPARRGSAARHHQGLSPLSAPAPTPTAGADDLPSLPPVHSRAPEQQTTPHFGFPLQPTVSVTAPPAAAPSAGEGYPFIGSNPTVPLPTGVTDTATVLPVPDRGDGDGKEVGRAALVRAQIAMIGLLVVFSMVLLSWS